MTYVEISFDLPNVLYDEDNKVMSELNRIYSIFSKEKIFRDKGYDLKLKSRHSTFEQAKVEFFPELKKKVVVEKAIPNQLKNIMDKFSLPKTITIITK